MKIIKKNPLLFILGLMIILGICFFLAINIGSIKVSFIQLMKGLFIEYNKDVASIYQIRFPRVIYQDKVEKDVCYETLSEDEPTVYEFKTWMQDISDFILINS